MPADPTTTEYLVFSPMLPMTEWWHWFLLLAAIAGVTTYVVLVYRRDSLELPLATAFLLAALRVLAFVGLLLFFFGLEKRTEKTLVKNSQALVLIDTSQSFGLEDADAAPDGASAAAAPTRISQVIERLDSGRLIPKLREKHDVTVYRFDDTERPEQVAFFQKFATRAALDVGLIAQAYWEQVGQVRLWLIVAGGFLLLAIIFGVLFLVVRDDTGGLPTWALPISVLSLVMMVAVLAIANIGYPDVPFLVALGVAEPRPVQEDARGEVSDEETAEPQVDWSEALAANGIKTRLGDSLANLIERERSKPVAGIVIFTDGRNNSGVLPEVAAALAQEARIPVHTVGVGSVRRQQNVRLVDVEAPVRVYPGDEFSITAYLQQFGLKDGQNVTLRLVSKTSDAEDAPEDPEESRNVTLGSDGQVRAEKFTIQPREVGKRTYTIKVESPDRVQDDPGDNARSATVEVIDRQSKVLIMAGGPMREYRFLRNQLFRDKDVESDVLLQSSAAAAKAGLPISQESAELLTDFPTTPEKLFEYDCIIAFDPDWRELSDEQVALLERFVAQKAGGLIVVAGPVYTKQWSIVTTEDKLETIRDLYPVDIESRRVLAVGSSRFTGESARPLAFTPEAVTEEFLWLGDSPTESEENWANFDGVYGYYIARSPKPGARVYARVVDAEGNLSGEEPIYIASQFYGAGRVLYLASGEMWRIREVDETFFEEFYTKAIRWAAQGRLQRDSARGVLMVDKEKCLKGDTVAVRASLTDLQFQPLEQDEVTAYLYPPGNGARQDLRLSKVQSLGGGMFAGQFVALREGEYRIDLPIPDSVEDEMLQKEVRASLPDLEIENPQLDAEGLRQLAFSTGGYYFDGVGSAVTDSKAEVEEFKAPPSSQEAAPPGSVAQIMNAVERERRTAVPGSPDKAFQETVMLWLLAWVVGVLSLEWLIRRLNKLA